MTSAVAQQKRVLYLVACGTPEARRLPELIAQAQDQNWVVCVLATPQGYKYLDASLLEELTGHPVRHEYKQPGDVDALPPAEAMIVCPATFNTINKWASGIADTLALSLLTEAIGLGLPLVAAPMLNSAQAAHPAFDKSLEVLRSVGVNVLYGPGVWEPGAPGTGASRHYDWSLPLKAMNAMLDSKTTPHA
nr:flavoprotein [Cryptosporangium phraense]